MKLLLLCLLAGATLAAAQDAQNTLTEAERAEGYKLLFDGTKTTLKGLQKSDFFKAGWKIVNGALTLEKTIDQSGKVTGGDLATAETFGDFDFSFDWQVGVSGDSGVLYFVKSLVGGKPQGNEFQIIDDVHHPDGLKGGPMRRTGGLYGVLPPAEKKRFNATGWNTGRLVVQGMRVEHWINGEKVLEYDAGSPGLAQAVRASGARLPMGFGAKTRSSLVLLDQGENVAFRNLKVKPLAPPTPAPMTVPGNPVERNFPANPMVPGVRPR